MQIKFGTKAETLERLQNCLRGARILPQFRSSVADWQRNRAALLHSLSELSWSNGTVIVRSSALAEDQIGTSNAGKFLSLPGIRGIEAATQAIDEVVRSMSDANDQFFVQPMLERVAIAGVAFSRDPTTGGPYFIINYDSSSKETGRVTGGTSNALRTLAVHRSSAAELDVDTSELDCVIALLRELECHLGHDALDVEFAIDEDRELILLQVRPLLTRELKPELEDRQRKALIQVEKKIEMLGRSHPYLFGLRTVYGVMPDWNPAEIIGIRPRPLAFSLYRELVTDSIWAYQRDNYGYKNLRSFPLIVNLGGTPYVDVRVSFNSFIPRDVEPGLAERLVNYYIDRLVEMPSRHDKVEFEIIFSCYTLDLPDRISVLKKYGFSDADIGSFTNSLRKLTNRIVHRETGLWRADLAKVEELDLRRQTILNSRLDTLSKIYWLLEDCKRYGTLPFAGLARAAFIAVQFLQSLRTTSILDEHDYQSFMRSLDTVGSRLATDIVDMELDDFLVQYGHLRPGTYDILSPRYDAAPDRYFSHGELRSQSAIAPSSFSLTLRQLDQIRAALAEHGIEQDVLGVFEFIKAAIEGREWAKFVFTRSLSDAMTLISELALEHGLSEEDSSFIDIHDIVRLYSSSLDVEAVLRQSITSGREAYAVTQAIILPPLICSSAEIWRFEIPESEPNFITLGKVVAPVARLDQPLSNLSAKIIAIPSADPGFDWIFSHDIAGFITEYGGANSHMAIRAGEMNVPAVIGAGQTLFRAWSEAHMLSLDCGNKQVQVLA